MTRAKSWTRRWWRRVRILVDRRAVERELDEELAFHIAMEAEKLRRGGASAAEARRRAALAFGGVEPAKEAVRDARWLAWAPGLSLDLRLGARMLAKAPGLAVVGGLGMAVAVAISAGAFTLFHSYFYPDLPLDEGDRVVSIVNWDPLRVDEDRQVLHDFAVWRRELRSVVDLGAFRSVERNLIAKSGDVEPIALAEMSAAGFRLARVAPLLGRTLLEGDERPGAPPVIVIGERLWRTRFDGDPAAVGRTMRLGAVEHTIVGVMPAKFAFPISHGAWVPLRFDAYAYEAGAGPSLDVFGRLAPGATREKAQAELVVIGRRLAASRPGTPEARLQPRIVPYTEIVSDSGESPSMWRTVRLLIVLLLVVVAMNVGVLVYARTMNRSNEIAVRTALGASRRRIVTQLFAEALVLSGGAAVLGLVMVAVGLRWFDRFLADSYGNAPFWINSGLTAGTVLHALALSVLGAAIVGLFPALRATRAQLRSAIGSTGAGSQARLGPTWTALIVVQVAAAVAILPPAMLKSVGLVSQSMRSAAFPAEEFLVTNVVVDAEDASVGRKGADAAQSEAAAAERLRVTMTQLLARLADEPAVAGAAISSGSPWTGGYDPVEAERGGRVGKVHFSRVGDGWLELHGVRLLAGRTFVAADAAAAGAARAAKSMDQPVVVNRTFVDEILGGGAAMGRRVRYRSDEEPQPWLEIVGVVEDFPAGFRIPGQSAARMYHPAAVGDAYADTLTLRLRGEPPAAFVPKLRRIAATVDPTLQLSSPASLDTIYAEQTGAFGRMALSIALVAGSVLLLSAAGIHALVSFTVNKRHREIGIRTALGASARRILSSVLARAAGQLTLGVVVGLTLAVLLDRATGGELMSGTALTLIPATGSFAILVGLVAAAGPARRALRVEPTEAIRAD